MQWCSVRSCGVFGLLRFLKYAGRPYDNLLEVRPDAYGDHVLRNLLAKANAQHQSDQPQRR
jgi:hypothetical protein